MTENNNQAVAVAQKARAIDAVAGRAASIFGTANTFEEELQVAAAMQEMRALLTPDIMAPIMGLMNTDLGFRTDRDPRLPAKPGREPIKAYPVEVVRDVVIEARLRGFHVVGNEFNIIAGRFYGCQSGFRRKVITHPEVTDLKDRFEVPRRLDGGAIVKCSATWKRNGIGDSIEREFPIKTDEYTGADAIRGKAERKLYAAIWNRLSGRVTPEGEVGELEAEPVRHGRPTGPAKTAEPTQSGAASPPPPGGLEAPTSPTPPTAGPGSSGEVEPWQDRLAMMLVKEGYNFDDFAAVAREAGWEGNWDNITSFEEVPVELAKNCVTAKRSVLLQLERRKKGGGS